MSSSYFIHPYRLRQSLFIGDTARPALILGFNRNTRVDVGQPTKVWISAKNLDPENSVKFKLNYLTEETDDDLTRNDKLTTARACITVRKDGSDYSPSGVVDFNADFSVATRTQIAELTIVPHGLVEAFYEVNTKWLEFFTSENSGSGRLMLDIVSPVDLYVVGVGRANRVDPTGDSNFDEVFNLS